MYSAVSFGVNGSAIPKIRVINPTVITGIVGNLLPFLSLVSWQTPVSRNNFAKILEYSASERRKYCLDFTFEKCGEHYPNSDDVE